MRGKGHLALIQVQPQWITPAYAGKRNGDYFTESVD